MSRIHEALKKAELERAVGAPTDITSPFEFGKKTEPGPGTGPPINPSERVRRPAGAPDSESVLKFEDIKANCNQDGWLPDKSVDVFQMSGSPTAEQFRTLRSRLYQLRNVRALRSILVTSSLPEEGKTFITHNLGQAIARQQDRRVLIIDADLRHPCLHLQLGAPNRLGLSDFLLGKAKASEVIQHGQEGGLYLIPSGTKVSNPSELISNGRMKMLLEQVSSAFDWLIFDSPPCLPVADANILADFVDGVLLIAKAGSTPSGALQKARQKFEGKNVLGVVLNAADETMLQYNSYYSESGSAHEHSEANTPV
jgi:protein-tyrosine kinase